MPNGYSTCCSPGVGKGVTGVVIDTTVTIGVGVLVVHGSGIRVTAVERNSAYKLDTQL